MRTPTSLTPTRRAPRHRARTSLLVVIAMAFFWIPTACGGTTGNETTSNDSSGDASAPLVYGVQLFYDILIPFMVAGLLLQILLHFWRMVVNR